MGRNVRLIILGSVAAAVVYTVVTNGRDSARVVNSIGGVVGTWQRGLVGYAGNAGRR